MSIALTGRQMLLLELITSEHQIATVGSSALNSLHTNLRRKLATCKMTTTILEDEVVAYNNQIEQPQVVIKSLSRTKVETVKDLQVGMMSKDNIQTTAWLD